MPSSGTDLQSFSLGMNSAVALIAACMLTQVQQRTVAGQPELDPHAGLPGGTRQAQANFDPLDYPVIITQKLMCQACYAGVKETFKKVPELFKLKKKMSREILMFDAIDRFCDEERFMDYSSFPYEFKKGCKAFLDKYNDNSIVESRMVEPGGVDHHCGTVCAEVCDGIDGVDRHAVYTLDTPPPPINSAEDRKGGPAVAPASAKLITYHDPVFEGDEEVLQVGCMGVGARKGKGKTNPSSTAKAGRGGKGGRGGGGSDRRAGSVFEEIADEFEPILEGDEWM